MWFYDVSILGRQFSVTSVELTSSMIINFQTAKRGIVYNMKTMHLIVLTIKAIVNILYGISSFKFWQVSGTEKGWLSKIET